MKTRYTRLPLTTRKRSVFAVKRGEWSYTIAGKNANIASTDYSNKYELALTMLHRQNGDFSVVKDRRFFIYERKNVSRADVALLYECLVFKQAETISK